MADLKNSLTKWLARWHRWLGLLLCLPLLVWSITGFIFLFKPGYQQAYDRPQLVTYPARQWSSLQPAQAEQIRRLNTLVGEHLLAERDGQWQQLWPQTGQLRPLAESDLVALVRDAIHTNPERYGQIDRVDLHHGLVQTTTGVTLTLNWNEMTLTQEGADTRRLRWLYDLHYLRWSGHKAVDEGLGIAGLCSLLLLTVAGLVLWWRRR